MKIILNKQLLVFLLIFKITQVISQSELDYIFFIKGCHYSGEDCYIGTIAFSQIFMKYVDIDVEMEVSFTKSCKYTSENVGWNKLYRLEKLFDHKDRSLRLGWRTNQKSGIFEIGLYAHIFGEIESVNMDYTPDFNSYNKYYMRMKYNGMFVRAGDNSYCIKRKIFTPDIYYGLGLATGAFFGGEDPAPKWMDMWVKNTNWNTYSSYWDEGPNKGFCNSIFYYDEYYSVYASGTIKLSLPNTHTSAKRFTIIEPESNLVCIAGKSIKLLTGFHAKHKSHFKAIIVADKKSLDTISNLFLVNDISLIRNQDENYTSDYKVSEINNYYSIFPNPTQTGLFTLRFNDGESKKFDVEVRNMTGKTVFGKTDVTDESLAVDIRGEPSGIYLVKVTAGGKVYTEKVIVQ